jgi:phage terminase large subunit-like protein
LARRPAAPGVDALKRWRLACPDWEKRLREGRSLVPKLPLDHKQGDRAVRVLGRLRLADVPGTPTMAEAGGEWFFDIVRALFGSLDPKTQARAIRELFVLVPKKNNKTTGGALLMLTALLLNLRPRAPFIMTAPVQDVADLAFTAAAGAIALDPVLSKLLHVREHLKTIVHRETKAALEIMTFDPSVLTGQKVAGALIDELHVVARARSAASAIRQLRGGMMPYPEAFLAFITTQSEDTPAGVFKDELQKARAIRDGKLEGSMLPVLYEFPEKMQQNANAWRNPKNWHMVTPNAGRSVDIERLREDFATAENTGEAELRAWASQHLNVEIGLALHSDRWAGADFWAAQGDRGLTLDSLLERCEVVVVGIDGGGLDDLLGLTVLGRERDTHDWLSWSHGWAHPSVLERRKAEAPRFKDFAKDGDLTLVERIGEDVEALAAIVKRIDDAGLLPEENAIGVDQVGVGGVLDAIEDIGVAKEKVVGISQGWKLTGAIKTAERRIAEGALRHGARPFMAWVVGNAKVEPRGNAILITKQASGTAKIDPLMALFNAVYLMALNPEATGPSVYERMAVTA